MGKAKGAVALVNGLMAVKGLPSRLRIFCPSDPSGHFQLLLSSPASLSLWLLWLSRASPGLALVPLSNCLRLSSAVLEPGFDLDVPISPAPFLLLPAFCLWLPAVLLCCSLERGPQCLRPVGLAVDQVAGCGKSMGQSSRGQAVVALLLVQEEAESVRLGHSELGGTELV